MLIDYLLVILLKDIFIMNNRYYFFKRLYPKYVILFKNNNEFITKGVDNNLKKYLKYNDINYVIVNKDNTCQKYIKKVNNYDLYLIKEFIWEVLNIKE